MRHLLDALRDRGVRRFRSLVALVSWIGVAAIGFNPSPAGAVTGALCSGDCDRRGAVTVDEIVALVNVALGMQLIEVCAAGDTDTDGAITVDEILSATGSALDGCPTSNGEVCGNGIAGVGEACDDGGVCIGGPQAGAACTAEDECVAGGACFGGADDLHACAGDDDCRAGRCVRCRPIGGDGCAANCTFESDIVTDLVPGIVDSRSRTGGLDIVPGTSGFGLFCSFFYFPVAIQGRLALKVGSAVDGSIPVAVKAGELKIDPVFVQFGCECIRNPVLSTCGGTTFDLDGEPSPHCNVDFPAATVCPAELPCAAVHGRGNSGSGFIRRGGASYDTEVIQDCKGEPGEPPGSPVRSTLNGDPPADPDAGNALLTMTTAFGLEYRTCAQAAAEGGPDGEYCTDDDPLPLRGVPMSLPFSTGTATGLIRNPVDFEGDQTGPHHAEGSPFAFGADGGVDATGAALTAAFTACDVPRLSDIVVPILLSMDAAKTPGPSDCCQCDRPMACAAAIDGSCGECEPAFGAACEEESGQCQTLTPTATTTPTPTPTPGVRIVANQVRFDSSTDVAELKVSLIGVGVAGFQNDIVFDNTVFRLMRNGCRLNRVLPHSLTTILQSCGSGPTAACPPGAGSDISALTMLVSTVANDTEIPPVLVYVCELELLAPDRLPSVLQVRRVFARDTHYRSVPAGGVDGVALRADD